MTSADNLISKKIVLRPAFDTIIEKMPSAKDIFKTLSREDVAGSMALSDMFIDGFVYKPITLNTGFFLSENLTDTTKRLMKKMKKAKFIETDKLNNLKNARSLAKEILEGRLEFFGDSREYIASKYCGKIFLKPTEVFYMDNPYQWEISSECRVSFYISAEREFIDDIVRNKEMYIGDTLYILENAENPDREDNEKRGRMLCSQGEIMSIKPLKDGSVTTYKLSCNPDTGVQSFKPGSVVDEKDFIDFNNRPLPYLMFI